ncbi:MAG: hypothetical protein ACU88J_15990 [Gammaproteobacteria bacterium]
MKIPQTGLIVMFLCTFAISVKSAPPLSEDALKIPSVTRQVKIFSDLEIGLIEALKNRNQLKLDKLVSQDFEMRTAVRPDNPVPYSEWLKNSLTDASGYALDIGSMAVHDLHDTAIVSFLWNPFGDNKQVAMPDIFLVDVWKRTGLEWKLAIRYASPVHDAAIKIPGFSMDEPVIEKKY